MLYRWMVLLGGLVASVAAPVAAHCDEVDELQAAFERNVAALNRLDLDAFVAGHHDQQVSFGPFSPFPRDGNAEFRHDVQEIFATSESITFKPTPHFRVINHTGLVWGHYTVVIQPKKGRRTINFGRFLVTALKADGKWLIVARQFSPLPSDH